jgi:hypothetical protein
LVVIVARDSPVSDLTSHEQKRLYLGEGVSDASGTKLIPLSQSPRSPDRIGFDRAALGMTPEEVTRYWIDRKIRGQSGPPKAVAPLDRLRAAIKRVDGTVTYLRVGEVQDGMKVLIVDGKSPGDSGYPLSN